MSMEFAARRVTRSRPQVPVQTRVSARRAVCRSRGALLAAVGCLGVALRRRSLAAQISVDPMSIAVHDTGAVSLRVYNPDKQATQVTVSVGDWDRARSGATRWHPFGSQPSSCGPALQVSTEAVTVEPGATALVRVAVTDPARIQAGCWAVVHLDMDLLPDPKAVGRTQIRYQVRMAIKVVAFAQDAVERLAIDRFVAAAVPDTARRRLVSVDTAAMAPGFVVALKNTGRQQVEPVARVELRRASGGDLVTPPLPVAVVPMLPGAVLERSVALPTLAPGAYVAVLIVDWGGADVVASRAAFVVQGR